MSRRIAEIGYRKARHYGIKVYNAKRLAGSVIKQNIVALGIVMADSERQFPGTVIFKKHRVKVLTRLNKLNFILRKMRSAGTVFPYGA